MSDLGMIVGEWSPYPETKPEFDEAVLVLTVEGFVHVAEFWTANDSRAEQWFDFETGTVSRVTHWARINRLGRQG